MPSVNWLLECSTKHSDVSKISQKILSASLKFGPLYERFQFTEGYSVFEDTDTGFKILSTEKGDSENELSSNCEGAGSVNASDGYVAIFFLAVLKLNESSDTYQITICDDVGRELNFDSWKNIEEVLHILDYSQGFIDGAELKQEAVKLDLVECGLEVLNSVFHEETNYVF